MAAASESGDTEECADNNQLEFLLNKSTNPHLSDEQAEPFYTKFCDQLNDELEGPQIACRLLAHKIQSPQEKEALRALAVCDACVRNCGQRFHNELGKFRFLNELIKILSPKYLAARTPDRVRTRATELLYSWAQGLRQQTKVKQAYDMLKQQGIVSVDPKYMDEIYEPPPPPPKPRCASFEDESKAKLLASLLKSKNPDDLMAANRLIKSMVKEDERKADVQAAKHEELTALQNNARLLMDMVQQFDASTVSIADLELMTEMYDTLVAKRGVLFRYATEAGEADENTLAEVLSINDDVGKVIDEFKARVESDAQRLIPADRRGRSQQERAQPETSQNPSVVEALMWDLPSASPLDDISLLGSLGTPLVGRRGGENSTASHSTASSLHELSDVFAAISTTQHGNNSSIRSEQNTTVPLPAAQPISQENPADPTQSTSDAAAHLSKPRGLFDLDMLSQTMIQSNLPDGKQSSSQFVKENVGRIPLKDIPPTRPPAPSLSPLEATKSLASALPPMTSDLASTSPSATTGSETSPLRVELQRKMLESIDISLTDIQPDTSREPCVILNQNKLQVRLLNTLNTFPNVENVYATVITVTSTNSDAIRELCFEASTQSPNSVVRLLPTSSDELSAYNPILPAPVVSQIMLVATNSRSEDLELRYCLSYATVGSGCSMQQSIKGTFQFLV